MKKALLSFSIIAVLLSCSSDNNSNDDTNNPGPGNSVSIVGTWKKNKEIIISGKDNSVISNTPSDDCEKKTTFIFLQNNTVSEEVYENSNGSCIHYVSSTGNYSYDSSNKKVSITLANTTDVFEVPVLSSTELQMNFGTLDANNDGFPDKLIYSFLRQ